MPRRPAARTLVGAPVTARGTRGELRAEMLGVLVSVARGEVRGRSVAARVTAASRAIQALDRAPLGDEDDTPLTPDEARAVLAADPTIRSLVLASRDFRTEVQ